MLCHDKPFLFFCVCWTLPEKPKQTQNCFMYVCKSNWPYITLATIYHIKHTKSVSPCARAPVCVCVCKSARTHVHHLFSSHPSVFVHLHFFLSLCYVCLNSNLTFFHIVYFHMVARAIVYNKTGVKSPVMCLSVSLLIVKSKSESVKTKMGIFTLLKCGGRT